MPIATTNPTTGEVVRTFEELSEQELDARLERASVAFRSYRRTSYEQRAGGCARRPTCSTPRRRRRPS
jgi:succinate-semialdehyde dehydrogenase/glutarate-semialdehyde dehydrogenase